VPLIAAALLLTTPSSFPHILHWSHSRERPKLGGLLKTRDFLAFCGINFSHNIDFLKVFSAQSMLLQQ
jgi:hypothetical protein